MKTSAGHLPRLCKGRMFTSPKFWGTLNEVLDSVDKHVRNNKKIQVLCLLSFFSRGYVADFCLVDVHVMFRILPFLSPGGYLLHSSK